MSRSRRLYRFALLAYPPAYRAARGEEILQTLMDVHPASGAPDLFEVISLVCDGLRRRAGARP